MRLLHPVYWSLLPLLFLLTSCSTMRYPVQGVSYSSKPYYVRDAWHYPQHYYDYDRVGLASWYGPDFHGRKKAMGEIYNQYTMTAAHKTLPLPTIAKVTNLENGKSVIVLIDDRGPFKYKNRIIDLSVSAAKRLGTHRKGIGKVRVQSLPKESDALSLYLKNHGTKTAYGHRRTWEEIYRTEIGSRPGYKQLSPIPQLSAEELRERAYMHQVATQGIAPKKQKKTVVKVRTKKVEHVKMKPIVVKTKAPAAKRRK